MALPFKLFLKRWLINTLAVLVAASLVPGIQYEKPLDLFLASLVLGILNAFIRPLIMLLALPLVIFTLGLFTVVINALLLYLVGYLLRPNFIVGDFWSALLGALIIGVVSLLSNFLIGDGSSHISFRWRKRPQEPDDDDRNGPIIDV